MKTYQSPEVLVWKVDFADILTSSVTLFSENGYDDNNKLSWGQVSGIQGQ